MADTNENNNTNSNVRNSNEEFNPFSTDGQDNISASCSSPSTNMNDCDNGTRGVEGNDSANGVADGTNEGDANDSANAANDVDLNDPDSCEDRCVICLGPKRSPVCLRCGHTFCNACITRHTANDKYPWSKRCPICRKRLKDHKPRSRRSRYVEGATTSRQTSLPTMITTISSVPTATGANITADGAPAGGIAVLLSTIAAVGESPITEPNEQPISPLDEFRTIIAESESMPNDSGILTSIGSAEDISDADYDAHVASDNDLAGDYDSYNSRLQFGEVSPELLDIEVENDEVINDGGLHYFTNDHDAAIIQLNNDNFDADEGQYNEVLAELNEMEAESATDERFLEDIDQLLDQLDDFTFMDM